MSPTARKLAEEVEWELGLFLAPILLTLRAPGQKS